MAPPATSGLLATTLATSPGLSSTASLNFLVALAFFSSSLPFKAYKLFQLKLKIQQ